ncbi:MAG: phosphate acyltransferase PlsX [Elusimicrobia bacterium]|nr:phosphate acyltransferase PlsX [Elusimicrobiota bacterium]
MRIALDAMGGDHAPAVTVAGAIEAARTSSHSIILVGKEDVLAAELKKHAVVPSTISLQHASEVITMDESPAQAVRQKRDSSLAVCSRMVADGKADAFASAGNSGAAMASALLYLRRIPGVIRPAIMTVFPTLTGHIAILDVGANTDCKPKNLVQFAVMGKTYFQDVFSVANPRVGLLSIGEEESKGNELVLETHELLRKTSLNFIGNVEGGDIAKGTADVIVCDGFVGNIVLKFGEGVAEMILKLVKEEFKAHPFAWAALPFLWPVLKDIKKKMDYSEYGGALLLGVDGVCVISHGKSNAKAIKNSVFAAAQFAEKNINKAIAKEITRLEEIEKSTVIS